MNHTSLPSGKKSTASAGISRNTLVIRAKHFFMMFCMICFLHAGLQPVHAQNPLSPAQGFNVFLLGNITPVNNETEGPIAIGGDLILAGSYQVSTNSAGSYTVSGVPVTLLVGGKITYQSGNGITVDQNGYIKIGNCTGSTVWYTDQNNAFSPIRITSGDYNGSPRINLQANSQQLGVSSVNNPVCQGSLINFASAFTQMQTSSTGIASKTDNANLTNANGNTIAHTGLPTQVKITLNSGNNILNLTGADMNNVQNFTFNNQPDASHVLVINVNAPGTFNWNVWNSGGIGGQNTPYILYNFYNTTTLNVQGGGAVEGTVFAPFADIIKTVNQANIEGQIVAKSYNQNGGENHYFPFNANVPPGNGNTCTGFRTQTQGGWGANPNGNNPGVYLHANFSGAFPNGLTIGCGGNTLSFSTAQSVTDLLPTGGGPAVLPTISVLVGQLVSASLSVGFDNYDASFGSNATHLQDLVITSGTFQGWTVSQLIAQANLQIGGCSNTYALSDINTALDNINNNYDDGTSDDGFLTCATVTPLTCSAAETNDINCHGDHNGEAKVTPSGGTSPYTYLWSNGQTTQTATALGTGTYNVTVTDQQGATSSCSVTLSEPSEISVTETHVNVLINGGNNGSIDVTVSGGTSPYTYLWNDGATTQDRTGLSAGTYTVTVTDHNGCSKGKTIILTQPDALNCSAAATHIISCHGDHNGEATVTPTGGSTPYHYLWSNGQTTQIATGLGAGTYNVTVTDDHGATTNCSATLTEPSEVSVTETHVNVSINGGNNGSIDVTVTGGTGPYTYLWNDGATSQDRTGLSAGTYTVTVTDHNGCSKGKTIILTQPDALNCSAAATHIISCHGDHNGEATVTPTGGSTPYHYLWSNGQTTQIATGLGVGTYNVTVTDDHGATTNCSANLTEPDELSVSETHLGVSIHGGNDGSIDITVQGGTGPYSFLWNDNAITEDRTGLTPGTYSVTVTDSHGCTGNATITIQDKPCDLTVDAGTDIYKCHGKSAQLHATASNQSATYSWAPTTGLNNSHISNPTTNVTATTTYTVTVSAANCSATDAVMVTTYPIVKASIKKVSNNSSCGAPCVRLQTPFNANWTYDWRLNSAPAPGDTHTNTYCACQSGSYEVKVKDATNGCNHNSKPFIVTINQKLEDQSPAESDKMQLTVWPNPASDVVNVSFSTKSTSGAVIELMDISGKILQSIKSGATENADVSFNTSSLPAGLYLVRFTSGTMMEVQKVIISK